MRGKKFHITPWRMGFGRLYAKMDPDVHATKGKSFWLGIRTLDSDMVAVGTWCTRISEEMYLALREEAKLNFATYATLVSSKDKGWKP